MSALGVRKLPLHAVALELTRYCNQHCDYCYNAWRADPQEAGAVDDRWAARLQRLLSTFEIDHVTLTGGEPFAYRGVFDVLDHLHAAAVPVQVISNGGLFDDALAARLARYPLRYVQVTLNGHTRALHDEHVGAGHFDKTLAGIRAMRRHEVPVVGCIVVTKKNAAHVGDILTMWRELGVRQVALSRFSPAGYAAEHAAQLLPTRDELTRAFELALPFAEGDMQIDCTMPVPPCAVEVERFAAIRFGSCAIGSDMQELALGPDGRLRNCTLHGHALADAGDIADPSVDLAAVVQHADRTQYRSHVPAFCRGCEHEHTCGGGCGAAAQWVMGSREHPDPFVAQHVDDQLASKLTRKRQGKTYLEVQQR